MISLHRHPKLGGEHCSGGHEASRADRTTGHTRRRRCKRTAYAFLPTLQTCTQFSPLMHVHMSQGSPFGALSKHGHQITTSFQQTTKKLSPVTFVDGQTKDFLKNKLHENQLLIWRTCVEATIYCALFHEVKRLFKHKTRKHRQGLQHTLSAKAKHSNAVCSPHGAKHSLHARAQPYAFVQGHIADTFCTLLPVIYIAWYSQ